MHCRCGRRRATWPRVRFRSRSIPRVSSSSWPGCSRRSIFNRNQKPPIMAEPFYITTAISYPNGRPHIGHAYEAIATDAIARYYRLAGRDVFFMTGTDEHGMKMAQAARGQNIEPRALADEMSSYFKQMDDALNISYDRFIRTTEPAHYRSEEHTSELQSLMRHSYAVFCLKKK